MIFKIHNYTYNGTNYRTDCDGQIKLKFGDHLWYMLMNMTRKKLTFFLLSFSIRNVMSGANILI